MHKVAKKYSEQFKFSRGGRDSLMTPTLTTSPEITLTVTPTLSPPPKKKNDRTHRMHSEAVKLPTRAFSALPTYRGELIITNCITELQPTSGESESTYFQILGMLSKVDLGLR